MKYYIRFDTERFLKDSRHWGELMADLRLELAAITEIGGAGGGIPSGGEVSRPTERTAIDRDKILQQMDTIKKYRECFRYAWDRMTEPDQILLAGFYYSPGYVYQFVDQWCTENASNRDYCYKAKREAEERFGAVCEDWIRMHPGECGRWVP